MKINMIKPVLALLALAGTACTSNYLDINSDPYGVTDGQMQTDGFAISSALSLISTAVIANDVNTAQFTDALLGGPLGGYYASTGAFKEGTFENFNAPNNWTRVFLVSDRVLPVLYTNLSELDKATDDPIPLAIGEVMKVCAIHRVTDTYGPIPYSQVAVGGKLQVPYDSQEKVYDKMFEELNHAIGVLTANRTGGISPKADYIYGGSAEKWCKLANSIKLRLAMRIVYVNPAKAREMAESAVNSEVGMITSNMDNAKVTQFGEKGNPIFEASRYNTPTHDDGSVCKTGGDTHAAADIICYMNAFNDARRSAYFVPSEWVDHTYAGQRRGIVVPELKSTGHKYSGINITSSSPAYWMNAAEVAFLRAEAKGVFGFNMGGEAKEFYNQGVRLSFEQWGAAGVDAYLAQNTAKEILYADPAGTNSYASALTSLPVAWNDGASVEEMQERIITQKWIANWQIGNEAWADYRRTGFPHLIPATDAGNLSNGVVNSKLGARRMPYPQEEYTNNGPNVREAVATHLKGTDNMATRVWWDCNPSIK